MDRGDLVRRSIIALVAALLEVPATAWPPMADADKAAIGNAIATKRRGAWTDAEKRGDIDALIGMLSAKTAPTTEKTIARVLALTPTPAQLVRLLGVVP